MGKYRIDSDNGVSHFCSIRRPHFNYPVHGEIQGRINLSAIFTLFVFIGEWLLKEQHAWREEARK